MTDRIALHPSHHRTPAAPPDANTADRVGQSSSDQTPTAPQSPKTPAKAEAGAGASSPGATALVQRHRATRRASARVDPEAFAARFASLPAHERYRFIRKTLEAHPELADRAIAVRTQGAPSHDRQIVAAVLARSKATGFMRYALAERTLAEVNSLSAHERANVLEWVESGKPLSQAVAFWKHQNAAIAAGSGAPHAPASMKRKIEGALEQLDHDIGKANADSARLYRLFRAIPPLSYEAELYTGAANTVNDIKSADINFYGAAVQSLAERNLSPLEVWITDPARQVQHVLGDTTQKVREANHRYMRYANAHGEYVDQTKRMQTALKAEDWATYQEANSKRQAAAARMHDAAEAFVPAAQDAIESEKQFDVDAIAAAANITTSLTPDGIGSALEPVIARKSARDFAKRAITYAVKQPAIQAARKRLGE